MGEKKHLIVIGGATASGKTALAIRLAQHFSTEIVSADSRQFYREMNIGTAKPNELELALVKHHFINNLSIHTDYSVGDYEREAMRVLETIFEKKNVAIMVGGTGLYIKAVCEGLSEFPETPLSIRQEFQDLYEKEGIEILQKKLQEVDYKYFMQVDRDNPVRLIRALSVWKATGKPFSSFMQPVKPKRFFETIYISTDLPRPVLYKRINQRVEAMIYQGLVEEARSLYPFKNLNALQTVGYSELFEYFEDAVTFAEAIDKIKQHTRNYAKRQVTWFKKDKPWQLFAPDDFEGILSFLDTCM